MSPKSGSPVGAIICSIVVAGAIAYLVETPPHQVMPYPSGLDATDPARGVYILLILVVFIGGSLALFAWRANELKRGGIFAPIAYAVPMQYLAYYTAVAKGTDVDQPRNLAKSVAVE